MSALVEFLLGRIAEDEVMAKLAADGGTGKPTNGSWFVGHKAACDCCKRIVGLGVDVDDRQSTHIARHDPERVLAECEAKRRIVARHTCCDDTSFEEPCDDVRDLAAAYVEHPNYDERWRPRGRANADYEVTLLRDLARRCLNGAPDPYQEFYDLGLSPLLDRLADALTAAEDSP